MLVYNGSAYVEGSATALAADRLRLALDVGVVGALVAAQEVRAGHAGRRPRDGRC